VTGTLSPDDVLRLRFIRDAQLSPDGKSVVYALMRTDDSGAKDLSDIWIHDLDSEVKKCAAGEGFTTYPRWSRDGSRLAYVTAREGGSVLTIVRVQDSARREIEIPRGSIEGPPAWSPDGRRIAVVLTTDDSRSTEVRRITSRDFRADGIGFIDGVSQRVCLIDLANGIISTLLDELGFYSHLEWDDTGERILFLGTSSPIPGASYSPKLYSVRIFDRTIREHLGDGWYIRSAKWLPGGQRIAVVGAYQNPVTVPTTDLWVVDGDGTGVSCRSTDVKGRVGFRMHHDMPIWDAGWLNEIVVKDADSAWVTVQDGGRAEIWSMSLSGPTKCERVVDGERACMIVNACSEGERFLFIATDMLSPPDLHIFNGRSETRVTHVNRDLLAQWPAVRQQCLQFRSADGLEVEGWFISDASRSGPVPTVMFIHGGPFMAAGHAYRFDFHLLATHGIGVLLANFRGSFGYGEEFALAIMGDWGARGFPDHMAAIDHAIELGLADSSRLGVWGASHGGFATCWLVGHSNRFRAAVAEAAVTNLTTAYYLSDAPEIFSRDLGGKPHEIPDVYRSRSPLTYAHRCETPTLLIHGEKDFRCPIAEAEQFHRALLDAGCVSEVVRLRDADHLGDSMGPPLTRVGQNSALLEWFKRFL
jgi:dipeptidyl aminopeptidase/acylaminoacyl peptidase